MSAWSVRSGWDETRVRQVLAHYETQSEEDAVAKDETFLKEEKGRAVVEVPFELIPVIREVIAQYEMTKA